MRPVINSTSLRLSRTRLALEPQQCACIGERDAAVGALKECYSQLIFELLNLKRQCRLCNVQKGGRTGHTAEFGDRKEKAKLPNIHFPAVLLRLLCLNSDLALSTARKKAAVQLPAARIPPAAAPCC
ncbi:hypothetical protein ACVWYH_000909 [Bradyrhizobium sp. GM24.11]